MTGRGIFITGTDTAVGKTVVACALARSLRAAKARQSVGYTLVVWPQSVETMRCSAPIFLTSAAAAALCAGVL